MLGGHVAHVLMQALHDVVGRCGFDAHGLLKRAIHAPTGALRPLYLKGHARVLGGPRAAHGGLGETQHVLAAGVGCDSVRAEGFQAVGKLGGRDLVTLQCLVERAQALLFGGAQGVDAPPNGRAYQFVRDLADDANDGRQDSAGHSTRDTALDRAPGPAAGVRVARALHCACGTASARQLRPARESRNRLGHGAASLRRGEFRGTADASRETAGQVRGK